VKDLPMLYEEHRTPMDDAMYHDEDVELYEDAHADVFKTSVVDHDVPKTSTGHTDVAGGPWYGDRGADAVYPHPDGSVTVVQATHRSGDRDARRQMPLNAYGFPPVLVDCPECAGTHGPVDGELSASNLTAAASGTYFGDLRPENILVPANVQAVLIDVASYGRPVPVDVSAVVRGLIPPESVPVAHVHGGPSGMSGAPALDAGTGKLVRLLKHWNQVSGTSPAPAYVVEQLVVEQLPIEMVVHSLGAVLVRQFVVGSARCAVRAAYRAREAVVRPNLANPAASRAVLAEFTSTWFGLRPTDANVDAVGNALLQAPLDGADPGGDHAAFRRLGTDVRRQLRAWRFAGDTQLRGRRVDSLDRPLRLGIDPGSALTVADTVAGGPGPDLLVGESSAAGWNDPRLPRVLNGLRSDEMNVAMRKVTEGLTWSAAAQACGRTAEFGERVRRRLKRLGADLTARIDAAQRTPRLA
jgi:hypothetical protein